MTFLQLLFPKRERGRECSHGSLAPCEGSQTLESFFVDLLHPHTPVELRAAMGTNLLRTALVRPGTLPASRQRRLVPCRRLLATAHGFHTSSRLQMSASGADIRRSFRQPGAFIGQDVEGAMEALAASDCVCFDVDSTVVTEEGINVLAEYLGKGEKVANLTQTAMEGGMKLQDALAARLELMQPAKKSVEQCLKERPLVLTDGVADLVKTLRRRGKAVFLVSGGFRIMIEPLAHILDIPASNIFANRLLFDHNGSYAGFDPTEPTSQDMGKSKALELIRKRYGFSSMVMVGDGATDAQAKPPATALCWLWRRGRKRTSQDSGRLVCHALC